LDEHHASYRLSGVKSLARSMAIPFINSLKRNEYSSADVPTEAPGESAAA